VRGCHRTVRQEQPAEAHGRTQLQRAGELAVRHVEGRAEARLRRRAVPPALVEQQGPAQPVQLVRQYLAQFAAADARAQAGAGRPREVAARAPFDRVPGGL
jgi:hypothetical protein